MQYRLRTLLILLAIGPPVLAGCVWIVHELTPTVTSCYFRHEPDADEFVPPDEPDFDAEP
jgi:hypothetical protein